MTVPASASAGLRHPYPPPLIDDFHRAAHARDKDGQIARRVAVEMPCLRERIEGFDRYFYIPGVLQARQRSIDSVDLLFDRIDKFGVRQILLDGIGGILRVDVG